MEARTDERFEQRHDVLAAAGRRLALLGHHDVTAVAPSADARFDLAGRYVVARVDDAGGKTPVDEVQALAGAAAVEGKIGAVFSVGGFADDAIAWGDRTGVALFVYDPQGDAEPVGAVAADAVARGAANPATFGTGDLAEPADVAAVLADGLAGGVVGEVSLWTGGAGQILRFWVEPGDRETAATVTIGLYPEPLGLEDVQPGPGWEQSRERAPAGGRETVWGRRVVHANQASTAVAGEAVRDAVAALAAFGVSFDRCRVELRPLPEAGQRAQDGAAARALVLGPPGPDSRAAGHGREVADAARVVHELLARSRDGDGPVGLEGVTEDGRFGWRLRAKRVRDLRNRASRWRVEVGVPERFLQPEQGGAWLRRARTTVGATRWRRDGDAWCTTVAADALEGAAHEAVAVVAAAYALAGAAFDRTRITDDP